MTGFEGNRRENPEPTPLRGGSARDAWIVDSLAQAIAYATSLTGQRESGEDVVHDCICRLMARAEHYDLPRDGRKLLFRSITNACLNLKRGRRVVVSLDDPRFNITGTWEIEDKSAPAPLSEILTDELRAAISAGLAKLPLRHRASIELTSLGFTAREIANMLDVNPDHVRVILSRARKSLAAHLDSRFPE